MSDSILVEPRKRPTQARSRATYEALVEATARVLVTEGFDKASTNRIAKVAGVSVGSLYQYFPNKEALVLAVVDRHVERVMGALSSVRAELADAPIEQAVRATIDALLAVHAIDPDLHEVLEQQVHHLAHLRLRQVRSAMTTLIADWLASRDDIDVDDPDATAFLLTVTVRSVTHETLADDSVDPDAVLAGLTRMLVRTLQPAI